MDLVAEIKNLTISTKDQKVLVSDVNLHVRRAECVGIVGESGSGKTLTMKALLHCLPPSLQSQSKIMNIMDTDLNTATIEELRTSLGTQVGFIPQNTVAYLHPLIKIKKQMIDGVLTHHLMNKDEALKKAKQLLEKTGIEDTHRVLNSYPSQLSGGMRQRVNIAIAMMNDPQLVIADEPTTALDALVQRQVLKLLADFRCEKGITLILISHDLQVVYELADRIIVMYAGQIVESAPTKILFSHPTHPYTQALIQTMKDADQKKDRLSEIPGVVLEDHRDSDYCLFKDRCSQRFAGCENPVTTHVFQNHVVRCIKAKEVLDGKTS